MKKKELLARLDTPVFVGLIVFVLAFFAGFSFAEKARAFSPTPVSKEATELCQRTGGEIIEEKIDRQSPENIIILPTPPFHGSVLSLP